MCPHTMSAPTANSVPASFCKDRQHLTVFPLREMVPLYSSERPRTTRGPEPWDCCCISFFQLDFRQAGRAGETFHISPLNKVNHVLNWLLRGWSSNIRKRGSVESSMGADWGPAPAPNHQPQFPSSYLSWLYENGCHIGERTSYQLGDTAAQQAALWASLWPFLHDSFLFPRNKQVLHHKNEWNNTNQWCLLLHPFLTINPLVLQSR